MVNKNIILQGDCLELMKDISDKSIDMILCDLPEEKITKLYCEDKFTLRMIAEKFNSNHHRIKRVLSKNNIQISQKDRKRKPFSEEHRRKISESRKLLKKSGYKPYNVGLKMSDESLLKNMKGHLKYDVSLKWLRAFKDIEKLKFLNKSLTRQRDCMGFTTEKYISFIEKFYYDKQFNEIYDRWILNKCKYLKPSLDHINPKSNGCDLNDLENLQFLTWFENRAKNDLSQDDWNKIKENIGDYLV